MTSMCFVVDLHALQTIHVLHLVDHVIRQRFDTHDGQDVMRSRVTVHQVFTLLDEVPFGDRDVLALGHHVLDGLHGLVSRLDADATLVLVVTGQSARNHRLLR